MKKLVGIFILVILVIFISMNVMIYIDNRYILELEDRVKKNTDIKDIVYVNEYDKYYIVMDNKNLYLFNSDYIEINKIDIGKVYLNKKDYDIVYRDNMIMYMDSYKNKDKNVVFRYYDIYTDELLDELVVGGS